MLSNADLRHAIDVVCSVSEACGTRAEFSCAGVAALAKLVPADIIHLSLCDLDTHHRVVVSGQPGAIGQREIEVFDHYFDVHPLVRTHGRDMHAVTKQISDIISPHDFRRTPIYNEYYRVIGVEHAVSCPFHVDSRYLIGFVMNRSGRRGFSARDCALLDLIQPHLSNLYRLSIALDASNAMSFPAEGGGSRASGIKTVHLTRRERQVLSWLAAGKTSRDISEILGNSRRTVEKHLEHIYAKLGVETRTAAVMRWATIQKYFAQPRGALENLVK